MSLWSDYLKERLGQESIEIPEGFIVYTIRDQICTLNDLYIKPDFRGKKYAFDLTEEVVRRAKEAGCKQLWAQVGLRSAEPERSIKIQLDYGFRFFKADNDYIILVKSLEE